MLDADIDSNTILAIAAICGAFGGIAFELLLSRRGGTGFVEMPARRLLRGRLWDAGVVGSIFIGAVAAVGFMVVYQPVEITVEGTTTHAYPRNELIAMSLVVGAAGSSILGALTSAASKVAMAAKLESILGGLQKLKESAPDTAEAPVVLAQVDSLIAQAQGALSDPRG